MGDEPVPLGDWWYERVAEGPAGMAMEEDMAAVVIALDRKKRRCGSR